MRDKLAYQLIQKILSICFVTLQNYSWPVAGKEQGQALISTGCLHLPGKRQALKIHAVVKDLSFEGWP